MPSNTESPRALLRALSSLLTGGLVIGGVAGAAAVATVGPWLAMGLTIWSGQSTEPNQPSLAYPWWLTMAALLVWGMGIFGEHRGQGGRLYRVLSWSGGLGIALLPMLQLWRLWGESRP